MLPPSYNLVYKPNEYHSYLRIINQSEIGVMWPLTERYRKRGPHIVLINPPWIRVNCNISLI